MNYHCQLDTAEVKAQTHVLLDTSQVYNIMDQVGLQLNMLDSMRIPKRIVEKYGLRKACKKCDAKLKLINII